MATTLYKPMSEKGGIFIGVPSGVSSAFIVTPNGQRIPLTNDHEAGTGNGYGNGFRGPPPNQIPPGSMIVDGSGQTIFNLQNPLLRVRDGRPEPGGAGDMSQGQSGVADAAYADLGLLGYNPASFNEVEPVTIEGVEPLDIFGIADEAGDRNKENILNSFAEARGVSREIIDESLAANKITLEDINDFNAQQQAEAFASLGPDAAKALDQGTKNLAAFSEGRMPDALENEILNQVSRSQQAQQSNIVGGGIASSFGSRVANQLSIQQRLGMQTSALNAAPSFLANALELRRGSPQKLAFDPNAEINLRSGIASQIQAGSNLAPTTAISSEFQNQANELSTQQFNANAENQGSQFNSQGQAQTSQYNASAMTRLQENLIQYDLFNEKSKQNYAQNVINSNKTDAADANTLGTATDNADANIASNEAAADNAATGSTIGAIGSVLGGGAALVDAFTGDDEETTTETTGNNGGGSTVPTVVVNESHSTPTVPSAVNSSGQTVSAPTQGPSSVVLPDGTPATVQDNGVVTTDYQTLADDYETIQSQGSSDFNQSVEPYLKESKLSTSPANFRRANTTSTKEDTSQINAHKTARASVPNMINPQELSQDQIQYQDGSTGFNVDKPIKQAKKIQGPIPSAIMPSVASRRGDRVVEDQKAVTAAMKTSGKIAKPGADSEVYTKPWSTESKLNNLYHQIAPSDIQWTDLGDNKFSAVLEQLDTIPLVNTLPTDIEGNIITKPAYYTENALAAFANSLGEV